MMAYSENDHFLCCVDPALDVLEKAVDSPRYFGKNSIENLHRDLSYFKMFFWGFGHGDINMNVFYLGYQLRPKVGRFRRDVSNLLIDMCHQFMRETTCLKREFEGEDDTGEWTLYWLSYFPHLEGTVAQHKQNVKRVCLLVLRDIGDASAPTLFPGCEWSTTTFIDMVLDNIQRLDPNESGVNATMKQQLCFIERKLNLFGKFASVCTVLKLLIPIEAAGCLSHIQIWAYHISCLVCLYWIDNEMDESTMGTMLSDLMKKYMPCTPPVIAMYLDILRAFPFTSRAFQSEVIPQLVASYVDFLLENLVINEFNELREDLIFLLSLSVDFAPKISVQFILLEINAIITQVPYVICFPQTNLSSFLDRMGKIKVQVRELYVVSPLVSQFNSTRNGALGFFNSFLANLKQMLDGKADFTLSVKHQIGIVHEELVVIKPFLDQMNLELLEKHEKLHDLWTRVVEVVYHAAYVTKLCPMTSGCVWYGIISLPSVIEDVKLVKSEIETMKGGPMEVVSSNKGSIDDLVVESSSFLLPQATSSNSMNQESFIGFEKDVEDITNHLVRGTKNLTIVSISGMAGQGKTTLAKKIYNDLSIFNHFHVKVWSYVSKDCDLKALVLNIARHVGCKDVNAKSEIQDIKESLRKGLKGKRYLIVLDDIWDVNVWKKVRGSLPDDTMGSRILFTCRYQHLASLAASQSISHHLQTFSEDESWKLMNSKLSHCNSLPRKFQDMAKKLSDSCHGLPLAISLIGSLLESKRQELGLWEEVAENLKSHLHSKECSHIIELSFKYLPEHLKPCFLYVGAFRRGESISPKDLKHFWIVEGFADGDLAHVYLDDLVAHNLIVVTQRNATGEIKKCNVHDLLYDLCLEKASQDNFLHFAGKKIVYNTKRFGFLHRLHFDGKDVVTLPQSSSTTKEVPTSQIHCLLLTTEFRENLSLFSFLSRFKVLTMLNLSYVFISVFPEVILGNIHLRYLSLCGISYIPASIVHLWNLETLIVVKGYGLDQLTNVTNALWEMESLKHVEISQFRLSVWPRNSSIMSNIEVLSGILLKDGLRSRTPEFLRRLSKLKKLKCDCHHPNAFLPMVYRMKKLESLQMNYSRSYYNAPYCSPPVFKSLDNLKRLSLKELCLPWISMASIGKLPNLEVLKLHTSAYAGPIWYLMDGQFSKLKYLKLDNLDVEQIDGDACDDDPFPSLKKLLLTSCPKLERIPSSFENISTLDIIDITGSWMISRSVRRVMTQQQESGNDVLQVFGLIDPSDEEEDEGDDEEWWQ